MSLKYKDIITLDETFTPVYDLENEGKNEWKRFIPNKKFYNVLKIVLDSLESHDKQYRKSFLIQGTYGTGKTHMTSVIKHLLWDENIEDFLKRIEDSHLRERLKNFRKENRVFPVVIKGLSNITDSRTFAIVLQKRIKEALKKEGIDITTKSDFEIMLYHLKHNPANIDFDSWIKENKELSIKIKNKERLIKRLEAYDVEILRILENMCIEKQVTLVFNNIRDWLIEVSEKLKDKGIKYLMIYWDEFTGVLEKGLDILTEVQSIAELSKNHNIFLFVVSHRTSLTASKLSDEDIKRIKDRFIEIHYGMEPITTYHILKSAINKIDENTWEQLKNEKITDDIKELIKKIAGENLDIRRTIEDLFPIHPYSAYLSTYIARTLGSANRSIFQFLYDENSGFKRFINENPKENEGYFLTCDYLWDYFKDTFERDYYEKFGQILQKYKLYIENIKNKGSEYEVIFKAILLLNVLYNTVRIDEIEENSLLLPTTKNIKNLFVGTEYYNNVEKVLNYLDESGIIQKTPNDEYIIYTSALPLKEIEREKERLKNSYKSSVDILSLNDKNKNKLIELFEGVLREKEIEIFGADISKQVLINRLSKVFKNDYTLHIAFFVAKDEKEIGDIKKLIKEIWENEEFRDIIYIVSEVELSEKSFNNWIEYRARAEVARNHNFKDDAARYMGYAEKIVENWISNIKSGYVHVFLEPLEYKDEAYQIYNYINKLSKEIFSAGLENIDGTTKNRNIWTKKKAIKSAEIFLFANSLKYIEDKTSKGPERYLREILKDNYGNYIVDENLNLKDNVDKEHPLVKMRNEIKKELDKYKKSLTFNLGDALKFLTTKPYGLYSNMVSMAAIGFLLREYIRKLYEIDTGKPIEKEIMREKIKNLFEYWEKGKNRNKLRVRFGTEEERKLIDILKDIFNIKEDVESLNDVKWKIWEILDKIDCPLWGLKEITTEKEYIEAINTLCDFINIKDEEIKHDDIVRIYRILDKHKYKLASLINAKNLEEGFIRWIKKFDIEDKNIDEVRDHIKKNMQEKCSLWDENKVEKVVLNWIRKQIKKEKEEINKQKEILNEKQKITKVDKANERYEEQLVIREKLKISNIGTKETINNDKLKQLKEKILNYKGDLKEVLITIIEKHPEFVDIIERYL